MDFREQDDCSGFKSRGSAMADHDLFTPLMSSSWPLSRPRQQFKREQNSINTLQNLSIFPLQFSDHQLTIAQSYPEFFSRSLIIIFSFPQPHPSTTSHAGSPHPTHQNDVPKAPQEKIEELFQKESKRDTGAASTANLPLKQSSPLPRPS
jgi:hypothetical protein